MPMLLFKQTLKKINCKADSSNLFICFKIFLNVTQRLLFLIYARFELIWYRTRISIIASLNLADPFDMVFFSFDTLELMRRNFAMKCERLTLTRD